jgi:hypothetical protein
MQILLAPGRVHALGLCIAAAVLASIPQAATAAGINPGVIASTEIAAVTSEPANPPSPGKPLSLNDRQPLGDEQLAGQHGQGIVLSNQTLASAISGNTIGGSYTAGAISFSDQAFTDFSGIGNITVNTGAQAALQSGVNITINLTN